MAGAMPFPYPRCAAPSHILPFVIALTLTVGALASAVSSRAFEKTVFSSVYADLEDFEQFAVRAKQSGATHIDLTPSLPWSYWEYDQPGDPYPAWVITKVGLLKTTRPAALQRYLPEDHSERVLQTLAARGQILRKHGLKGLLGLAEPSMLPEAVFRDHPLWRGARVDHPTRSRVARFAPSIDHPEVLALFREAMATLLRRCPEIDIVDILTNDSGSGLDWSPGLYSGQFGNTLFRHRSMDERLGAFFAVLHAGAADAQARLDVRIKLTREADPLRIARKLTAGSSIENLEGPDGTPFMVSAGTGEAYGNTFTPVLGIPRIAEFVDALMATHESAAPRMFVSLSDRRSRALFFDVYDRFRAQPARNPVAKLTLLREVARAQAGEQHADSLLRLWLHLQETSDLVRLLDTGGFIYYLGTVHQRWLTRPFVPFPQEIPAADKAYYRRFQFQALDEAHAESLSDVQATDVYGGWSGRHFVNRVSAPIERHVNEAANLAEQIGNADLARRLRIFLCIVRNAQNAVSYQAQLDRVRRLGLAPDPSPVVETQSGWDRQMMMQTARAELDNTALLMELLGERPSDYLLTAATPEEEDITRFTPDLRPQLQKKLDLMNARWEDYKRVFTTPNW